MQEQASQSAPQQTSNPTNEGQESSQDSDQLSNSLEQNARRLEREHTEQEQKDKQTEEQRAEREERRNQDQKKVPTPKASAYAAFHKQQVAFAQEKQNFAAQKAEFDQAQKAIANAKRSPADAVKALGYGSMKEFLEKVAEHGGEMTPEQQKIWDLEERLAAREKAEEEQRAQYQEQQEAAKYQQEIGQWHKAIREYVTEAGSPWGDKLVSLAGQEQQVLSVMQAQQAEYGDSLNVKEALEEALHQVNEGLEKQMRQGLQQIAAHPRGQAILNEIAGTVNSKQSRSPSNRAKQSGLNDHVRNETNERLPDKDLSLDDMLRRNSGILEKESRSQRW